MITSFRELADKTDTAENPWEWWVLRGPDSKRVQWSVLKSFSLTHVGLGVSFSRDYGDGINWTDWWDLLLHLGPWAFSLHREWNIPGARGRE